MVSSTFVVGTGLLSGARAFGQDRPSAAQLLDRGSRLYEDKQYAEAKKLLLDIDPAQLPEDQRTKLNDLLKNTDIQIAKSSTSGGFDEAQAALDADHYAAAAQGFQGVLDSPSAPQDVKDKAKIQLALVRQKQAEKVPQMRELLNQAESLYNEGKLDEAQNALNTVQNTGADLGWRDNARPAALAAKISERKTAIARGGNAGAPAGTLQVAAPGDNGAMTAPPAPGMSPAQAALDQQPAAPGAPLPGPAVTVTGGPTDAAGAALNQGGSPVDEYARTLEIQHDRYLALFNQAIKASNDAITANPPQYAAAVDRAQQALGYINEAYNARVLSDAEATNYRNIAQQQLSLTTTRRQVYEREQAQRATVDANRANARRVAELDKVRHRRIDDLMAQADHYYNMQQYQECADTLRLLVSIDPQNSRAKLFLTLVTDRINYRDFQHLTDLRGTETERQGVLSEESLIPYADLMIYPDDWVELSRRRLGDLPDQESAANRAVRQRLDEELNEISADQQGFEKVIGYLQTSTGTNIIVNWKALEGAGIDRNAAVTVNLKKVPFRKALTEILNEVGGATAALAYTVDDGVISISTKDDLTSQKYQVIRVFDIRDMLVQPDTQTQPPSFNLQAVTQGSGGGSGGGGGGNQASIFQTNGSTTTTTTTGNQAVVTEIVDTIQTIVAPDSWREKGGTIGSVRELNGQLIVNQTADNQTAVYNLLQQLRETRAIQISVEARLLLVSNNFLDDFGFGWSLSIPAGALGGNVGAISVGNNTDTTAVAPSTGVPGSLGGGGIPSPSLTVSGSIIDNYQLSLFLRATQADQRSVTVTAPRITLFNGQRGFIAVTAQRNYISNFNQTVAAGGINGAAAVATTLTVSTLSTGISLQVQATASADRRYVVMQIEPQLATLDGIDTFSSAPTGNTGNATASTLALIQLPRVSFTTINTMVSVPDGGTLLIGGQKLVGESEIEVGVPVLSKIPGLNRLFTNRNLVKDERTLLILVRPKIIIQKEIENGLFGPGYERPTGLPAGSPAPGVGAPGTAGFGIGSSTR
jgi:type II secretory pathway component GspD/PulD (secretin)